LKRQIRLRLVAARRAAGAVGAQHRGHCARGRVGVARPPQIQRQLQRLPARDGPQRHRRAEAVAVLHPVGRDAQPREVDLAVGDHRAERGRQRGREVDRVLASQARGGPDLDEHTDPLPDGWASPPYMINLR
jgi:hypothetical protein